MEVAGVVLGIIPVMLIGLQEVHGRTSKILFKYQHVIARFIRELDMEHAQLRSTLEKMLSGLVNEVDLAQLLDNQQHRIWKDQELENKLKQRLGPEAHRVYTTTVNRVAKALMDLKDGVGLQQGKKKWHHEMRLRLKKCIEDRKHEALLEEIRLCNQALSKLTDDTLVLEPLRISRKAKQETNKWIFIRELATSLHQALDSGWLCDCSKPHLAHLRLENRTENNDEEAKFGVLFSSLSTPKGLQETEIKIQAISSSETEESIVETPTSRTRTVSFSPDVTQTYTTGRIRSDSSLPSSPSDEFWDSKIEDLCCELKQCKSPGCIGFLDDESYKHYIQVFPTNLTGEDMVSLAETLGDVGANGKVLNVVELGLREKYELAVILATSVLQLHATPWLEECWSNKDVYFARKRSKTFPKTCAYIKKAFHPPRTRTMSSCELIPITSRPSVRNETIFALGVCLIELSLGRTLASFQEDADLGPDGQRTLFTDWMIANRLLKERIVISEGDRYSKTVHRCINCVFEPLNPSLEDAEFRQAFYDNAVVPLKNILVDFVK